MSRKEGVILTFVMHFLEAYKAYHGIFSCRIYNSTRTAFYKVCEESLRLVFELGKETAFNSSVKVYSGLYLAYISCKQATFSVSMICSCGFWDRYANIQAHGFIFKRTCLFNVFHKCCCITSPHNEEDGVIGKIST